MDTEKILRLASGRLESGKTHRIDLLRAESGLEAETFDNALFALAEEGVVDLVGGDTSEMSDEQIDGLFNPDCGDLPLVNLVWLKDPVRFLYVFRKEALQAYEEAGKVKGNRNKLAYEALVESQAIPGIKDAMSFSSFNQYITPLFKLNKLFGAEIQAVNDRENAVLAAAQRDFDKAKEYCEKADALYFENEKLKAKNRELEADVQAEKAICNKFKERIASLKTAHQGLLEEIDKKSRTIGILIADKSALEMAAAETKTHHPEPEQIKLFDDDEGERNMRDHAAQIEIQTIKGQMAEMQASFTAELAKIQNQMTSFFARPAPAEADEPTSTTTKKKIKDPDKPENIRVGAWNLNPVKRGSAWFYRAFRTYPGRKSPACVYIGKDTSRENVEKCLNAYNAKKGTDYQID